MADVVLYDIADEQSRQENADDGIHQVKGVGTSGIETVGQEVLYLMDEPFQEESGESGQYTDHQTNYQDEFLFAEIHPPPDEQAFEKCEIPFYRVHSSFRLFPDDGHFAVRTQFDDATGSCFCLFFPAALHNVVYRVFYLVADAIETSRRRLDAHVG